MIAISIIAHNKLETTKRCVDAVLKNSSMPFELYLTDNASTDETAEFFAAINHERVTIIENETNEGYIGPHNFAFDVARKVGYKYFVALNNDTLPPPRWLEMLTHPLEGSDRAALSGPRGGCCTLHPNMHGYVGREFEYVEGSCLCAKIELVAKHGPLFSEYLKFAYGEDSDLSLRMREKGYTIHKVIFDVQHEGRATAKQSSELLDKCHHAQMHNHAVLQQRWRHYLKVRRMDYPIVLERRAAYGDVLLLTPVVRALKEALPRNPVFVQTGVPKMLEGNRDVSATAERIEKLHSELRINLDAAYESRTQTHIIDAYADAVRAEVPALGKVDRVTQFIPSEPARGWAMRWRAQLGRNTRVCLLHVGPTSWPGKNWPIHRFAELATWLVESGWHVAVVGKQSKPHVIQNALDLTRDTTIHQLGALCMQSQLFIGIDSMPMHMAQAVGCPTVGIFGVTSSKYIMADNSARIGVNADPKIPCAGARHKVSGMEFVNCSPSCIESVSLEMVKDAVLELMRE